MRMTRLTGKSVLFVLAVTLVVVPTLASAQAIQLIDVPGATHTLALDMKHLELAALLRRQRPGQAETHLF